MSVTSRFANSSKRLISRFGKARDYKKVSGEETYDVETRKFVSNSEPYTFKMYKMKTSSTESQLPALVGKDSAAFLIAKLDVPFTPSENDVIVDIIGGVVNEFIVVKIVEYWAGDEPACWKLLAVTA